MDNLDDDLSSKQKEFLGYLENASNKDSFELKVRFKEETLEVFNLNSLITKNIPLITNYTNYKLFALLMVQLFIFLFFVLAAIFMKNNLVPYINSL